MNATELLQTVGRMPVENYRYTDGERTYQRVSTFLKNIETDTYNLDQWRGNMLAIGLSARPDLGLAVAAAAQFDPATGKLTKEARETLGRLREDATNAAKAKAGATVGTAIHTATERLDCGETHEAIGLPYPYNADLRAYDVLKRAMRVTCDPRHIERSVRGAFPGVVGTLDRLWNVALLEELGMLAPGELIVTDVKTEQDPLLNLQHICAQLATYANSPEMFVPDASPAYEPMPRVSKLVGLVIHIRNGRATPYLVNLTEGLREAQAAQERKTRLALSKTRFGEPGCWALPVPVELPPATEITTQAHERGPLGYSAPAGEPRAGGATAVRGSDGLVRWTPSPEDIATAEQLERQHTGGEFLRLVSGLLDAIRQADDMPRLAQLFELADKNGVPWSGDVAVAGAARATVVQCPQRLLHLGPGKCACGWMTGMKP